MAEYSGMVTRHTYGVFGTAYNEIMDCLTDRMQNEFINIVVDNWGSQQVYSFFRDQFKPQIDQLIVNVELKFNWIVEYISEAARKWWRNERSTYYDYPKANFGYFDYEDRRINVDYIKKDFDGTIGMNVNNIDNALNNIFNIINTIQGQLDNCLDEIWNCDFMFDDEYSNSYSLIWQIKNEVSDSVGLAMTTVRNARESYINVATRNKESFELSEE